MNDQKNLEQLNFSDIKKPPSVIFVAFKTILSKPFWISVAIFYTIFLVSAVLASEPQDTISTNMVQAGVILLAFLPMLFSYVFVDYLHDIRMRSWTKFISVNNLDVQPDSMPLPNLTPPGVVYVNKFNKKLSIWARSLRVFVKYTLDRGAGRIGQYSGIKWLLSSLVIQLTKDGGTLLYEGSFVATSRIQRSMGSPSMVVMRIDTGKALPRVLVDGLASRFKVRPPNDFVQYSPEGTFYKRFKLWFKEDSQIQALSLITPDVMEAIEKIGQKFDVETSGESLYIYTTKRKGSDVDALIKAHSIIMPVIKSSSFGHKSTGTYNKFSLDNGITVDNVRNAELSGWLYILFCNFTLVIKYISLLISICFIPALFIL